MTKRDGYRISDISTMEREGMLCPECHEFRLEKDPIAARDFKSKRDKLIHATRCGNDACDAHRITPKKIKQQMPDKGRFQTFLWENGTVATIIVSGIAAILVAITVLTAGQFAPAQPADVSGTITSVGGPQPNVNVLAVGNNTTLSTSTNSNGEFSFERVQPGRYTLRIIPPTSSKYLAPKAATLVVTDGKYRVIRGDGTLIPGKTELYLAERSQIRLTGVASNASATVRLADASNARRGIDITLVGDAGATSAQNIIIQNNTAHTYFLPTETNNATITVTAPITTENQSVSRTTSGVDVLSLSGTMEPRNVVLRVQNGEPYPDISSRGEQLCSSESLSRSNGVCEIPSRLVRDESLELVFEEGQESVDYTLNYTARAVARDVRVTVNGETYSFEGPADLSEEWTMTETVESLPAGENKVSLSVSDVGGVDTDATLNFSYVRESPPASMPSIVVTAPNGTTNTHQVPQSELTDGMLVGEYSTTLPPSWFGTGSNTVRVQTQNSGSVYVVLSGEAPEEQIGNFSSD